MDLQGFTTIDEVGDEEESIDKEVRNSNKIFSPHSAAEEIDYLNKIISDMEKDDNRSNSIERNRTDFDLNSKIVLGNHSDNLELKNFNLTVASTLDKLKTLEDSIDSSISVKFQLQKDKTTTQHSLVNEDHNFRSKEIDKINNSKSFKLIPQNNSVEESDKNNCSSSDIQENDLHSLKTKCHNLENSEVISSGNKHNSSQTLCPPKSSTEHVPCENLLEAANAKSSKTCVDAENNFRDSSNADCVTRNDDDNSTLNDDDDYINISLPIRISCIKSEPVCEEQSEEVDFGEYFNDPAEDFDMRYIKEELDFEKENECMSIQPIDAISIAKLEPVNEEESVLTTFVPKVHFKIRKKIFYSKEQVSAAAIMAQSSLALVINMSMFENLKLTMPVVKLYKLEKISPDHLLFEDLEMVDIFFAKYSNNPRKWKKILKLKKSHKENKDKNLHVKHCKNSPSSSKLKILQEQYREAINKTIAKNIEENYQNSESKGECFELSSKLKHAENEKFKDCYKIENNENKDKLKSKKNRKDYEHKHSSKKKSSEKAEDGKILFSNKHKHVSQKSESTKNISSLKESSDVHDKSFEGFSPQLQKEKWKPLILIYNIKPCVVDLSKDVSLIPTALLNSYKTNSHKRERSGHKHKKEKHKRSKDKNYSDDRNKKKHKDYKKERHKDRPRHSENFKSSSKNDDNLMPEKETNGEYVGITKFIPSQIINKDLNEGEVKEDVKEKFPVSHMDIKKAPIANSNKSSEESILKNEQDHLNLEVSINDAEHITSSTLGKDNTEAFTFSTPVKDIPITLGAPPTEKDEQPTTLSTSIKEGSQTSDISSNSFTVPNENSSIIENEITSDSEVKSISDLNGLLESNKVDNYGETDFKSFNKTISSNGSDDACNPVILEDVSNTPNKSFDIKGTDSVFSPSKLKDFSFDEEEKTFQEKVLNTTVVDGVNNSESGKKTSIVSASENTIDTQPPAVISDTSTKIVNTCGHSKLSQEDQIKFEKIENNVKVESFNNKIENNVKVESFNNQDTKEIDLSKSNLDDVENCKNMNKELEKNLNKNKMMEKNFKSIKKSSKTKKLKKCYVFLEDIRYNKLYRKKIKKEKKYWEKKKRKSIEAKLLKSSEKVEVKSDTDSLDSIKKSKRYNEKYFAVHPNLKNSLQEEKKQIEVDNDNSKLAEKKMKTLKEVPLPLFGLSFKIPKKIISKEKVDNKPQSLIHRNEAQTSSYYGPNNKFKPYNKDRERSKREKDFSNEENSGGKRSFESSSAKDKPTFFLNFNPDLMRKEWEKEKQNDFNTNQSKTPVLYDRMKNFQNSPSIPKKSSTENIKTKNQGTDHRIPKHSRPPEGNNNNNNNNNNNFANHHSTFPKTSLDNTNKIQQNFNQDNDGTVDNSDVDSTSSVINKLKKKLLNSSITQPHSSSNLTPKSIYSSLNKKNIEKNQEDGIKTTENSSSQSTFSIINKLRQKVHYDSDDQTPPLSSKPVCFSKSQVSFDMEENSVGDVLNSPCNSYGSPQSLDNNSVSSFNQSSFNPSIPVTESVNPSVHFTESKEEKNKSVEATDLKIINDSKDNFTPAEEDLAFYKKVDLLGKKEKLKLYIKYKALYNNAKKKFLEETGDIHKSSTKLKRYRELNMRRKLYYDLKLYLYEQKKQQYASKKQEYEALKEYQKYSVKKNDNQPSLSIDKKDSPNPVNKSVPDGKQYSPSMVIDGGDAPYSPSHILDEDGACSPSNLELGNEPPPSQNVKSKPCRPHTPPVVEKTEEPYSPSTAFDDEPYSPSASPLLSVCWKSPVKESSQFKYTVSCKESMTESKQIKNCEPYSQSNSQTLPNNVSDKNMNQPLTTTEAEDKTLMVNLKQKSSDKIEEDIAFFLSKKKKLLEAQKSQENSVEVVSPKLNRKQELNVQPFNDDKKSQVQDIVRTVNGISPPGSPIAPLDVNSSFITSTSALTTVLKQFVESEQCDNLNVNKSAIENNNLSEIDRNVNNVNIVNNITSSVKQTEEASVHSVENKINPEESPCSKANSDLSHYFIGNNSTNKVLPLPVPPPVIANQGKMNIAIPIVQSKLIANNKQHVVTPVTTTTTISSSDQQDQMIHNTMQLCDIPPHPSSVLTSSYVQSHVLLPVSTQSGYAASPNQILGVVAQETSKANLSKVEIDVKNIGLSLATALLLPPPPPPPAYPASAINMMNITDSKENTTTKEDEKSTKSTEKSSFASIISEFFDNWKDPTNEDVKNLCSEPSTQEISNDCKVLYSKLSPVKSDFNSMVAALYEKKPLAQPLIDKVDNVPLVGLQYVLEVQPEKKCSLENTSYICGLCSKKMSSATLVAHVKSVPHRLKFTECFCAELHEKFGKMEVKQWTAALVKEFTSSLLEVEKKNGRQCMAVAPEKSMNSAVNLLKNELTSILKGEKGKNISCMKSSVPPASIPSNSHKPSRHHSKELSPRHSKRPLDTNDKPGPKSSKVPRSEHRRSRERGPTFEKEKERDLHQRNDRDSFRNAREPNNNRSREPRLRKSPSPVHRRRRSPSPRNRNRDSPRKKSRTRSPMRQERFNRYDSAPRRDDRTNDRKLFDFREDESRAKKEAVALLERYLKNPESHPRYKFEWEKFWDRRCREVKQQGYDIKYFDFTSEWVDFWPIRLKEMCVFDYKERREEFLTRYRIDDPDFGNVKTDFLDIIELPKPKASNNRGNVSSERSRSPWRKNEKPHELESSISQEFNEPGFSVVGTLKLLTNLEDQLGSLYPGTKALLEKATYVTESGGNAMNLFENNDNIVLLRLANVKLSSLLSSGILGMMTSARTQRAIECTNWVLKEAEKFSPNAQSKRIESLGLDLNLMSTATIGMNTMQIAQYIAQQLFNIGKSDVDETVLQEILMAISENHTQYKLKTQAEESYKGSNFLPSASVNQGAMQTSNSDQTYVNQAQQSGDGSFNAVPALFPSGVVSVRDRDYNKATPDNTSNEVQKNTALSLLQSAYDHEEEAGKDKKDMDKLSLEELQNLLFNFKNLNVDEQQELTSYLKKLEATDNKKVTKLRSMMRNSKPVVQRVQQENQSNVNVKSGSQNIQPQKEYNDNKNYYYNRPNSFDQGYSKDSKHYNDSNEFEGRNSSTSDQYSKNYNHNQSYGGQQQISDYRKDESFSQNQKSLPPVRNITPKPSFDDASAGGHYQNIHEPNQFESTYSYNHPKALRSQGGSSAYRNTLPSNPQKSQHFPSEDLEIKQPLLSTPGMVSSRKPLLDNPEMNPRKPLLGTPDSSSRQPLLATPETTVRQPLLAKPKPPLLPNPRDEQPSKQGSYYDNEFQPDKQYDDREYQDDYQPTNNTGNFSDDSQIPFSGKRKSLLSDPQGGFGFQKKEYRLGSFNTSSQSDTSNYQSNYSSDRFKDNDDYSADTSQNDRRPYNSFYNEENEAFDENKSSSVVPSDFVSESFRNFSSSFSGNSGQGRYQACDDEPSTNEDYDSYNSPNNFNRSFQNNRGGFARGRGRRANNFKPR